MIIQTDKICICPGCHSRVNVKSYYYEPYYKCPKCYKKNLIIVRKGKPVRGRMKNDIIQ